MDEVAGECGVDRSESDDVGGGGVVGEESAVGHHDLHLDVDLGGACLPGDALDQGVGHDLTTGAGVPVDACGVGGLPECGQTGDALLDGQEAREVAHRVGRGSQADVAVGPCPARTADRGSGVEAVADRPRLSCRVTVAEAGELPGELDVDLLAVLQGQDGGLAHHQGGAPLADLSAGQQVEGVRHLADQHPRQAQVSRAAVGTGAPRQPDLAGQALPALRGRHPALCLAGRASPGQVVGDPRLGSGDRALQLLQARHVLDLLRIGRACAVERGQSVDGTLQVRERGRTRLRPTRTPLRGAGGDVGRVIEHVFDFIKQGRRCKPARPSVDRKSSGPALLLEHDERRRDVGRGVVGEREEHV